MTDGPYCRVYWSVMSDEKFDGIRENPTHLGSWLTLLLVADMAWPAPAFLPPSVSKRVVDLIEGHGLIVKMPGWRFRVTGLDAERASRSAAARVGGLASGRSRSVERPFNEGSRTPRTESNLAEQSKAEQSKSTARDGLPNLDATVSGIWETATGRSVIGSGAKVAEYLDDACRRHPPSEVGAAIIRARKGFDHIPDGMALVSGMRPILDPFVDGKAATKADHDREERAAGRRRVEATIRNAHGFGAHDASPDPRCELCKEAIA